MIALITGGSGCGKSTFAESLIAALDAPRRVYIATMQVYDEESAARVRRHRAQRARYGFETVERPMGLSGEDIPCGAAVLIEDLPNLLANEMFSGGDPDRVVPSLRAAARRAGHLIMVTNDVFSDGVRYPDSTDGYLRRLAEISAAAADMADTVAEVVYSIPVFVKGALPCARFAR